MRGLRERATAGAALVLAALVACGDDTGVDVPDRTPVEYGGGEFTQRIVSGGAARAYLVVVPPSAVPETPAPVLFVFHGTPQTVEGVQAMSDMDQVAGDRGWIVVYPKALYNRWASIPGFFPATAGQNDELFMRDILDFLDEDLNIDRTRVYAIGFSNGATMTHRVACSMAYEVAAVASVGATLSAALAQTCSHPRPLPMVLFLGDEDEEFPWEGVVGNADVGLSGEETAHWWADRNACGDAEQVTQLPDTADDGTTVERWDFPCDGGAETPFYVIRGGGHTWPGSPVVLDPAQYGRTTRDISASQVAVDFFEDKRVPPTTQGALRP